MFLCILEGPLSSFHKPFFLPLIYLPFTERTEYFFFLFSSTLEKKLVKTTEGQYVDDIKEGLWTIFYESGEKLKEIIYKILTFLFFYSKIIVDLLFKYHR